jgi:hypothetical protein
MKPCPVIEKAPRLLQLGMIVADHEAPANIRLELVVYPGVHHSFFYPELQPGRKIFGCWLEYNEEAATDATPQDAGMSQAPPQLSVCQVHSRLPLNRLIATLSRATARPNRVRAASRSDFCCRTKPSQRDIARFLHTRRSVMTFIVAPRTSVQRAAFDIVSIVPSTSMPWTTLPMTMTTARTI